MSTLIYGIIIILFAVYLFWTWNNTKCFEGNFTRISYIVVGTIFITLATYIIFLISKSGIDYPNKDMIGKIRNIILLVFVPINGFLTLPQIANTIRKIKDEEITAKKLKRNITIFVICLIIIVILECNYFGNIQNRIIQLVRLK